MKNQEKRFHNSDFEVRSENDKTVVEGYAARFDDETTIGGQFAERVARGAFDGADMSNTVALFNHDWNMPLARTGKGLELSVDEVGLRYRFELGEQSYAKDLAENIRMGNVSTSSFGFTVADDSWERRDGMNLRTINSVGTLFDVSPTTQGAYPTTEVALRSMEAAFAEAAEEVEEVEAPVVPEAVVEEVSEAVAEEVEAADIPENDEEEERKEEEVVEESEEVAEEVAEEGEEVAEERDGMLYKIEDKEEKVVAPAPKEKKAPKKKAAKKESNQKPEQEARNTNSIMEDTNINPAVAQSMGDTEARAAKDFNFGKFIKEAAKGQLTGLEAEMTQEGSNEMRSAGVNVSGGFNIPTMVLRSMGTATATSTAFGGTIGKEDAGIVANYAPADYATKLGVRNLANLNGDVQMQVQGTLTAAASPVEGAAQAEALPTFAAVTLSPTRYAAHVGVTQQMLAQSGDDMAAFIQMDVRRALDKQFNAAILAEIVANDTELAYASNNPLDVEEALLKADVDLNDVRFIAAADAYRTFRSLSLDAGSGNLFANDPKSSQSIIGFSGIVGSQAAVGKAHFFDRNQMVTGQWGGMNLIVDPYTAAADGVVRIIANEYRDVEVLQAASFQTITGA